MSRQTILIGLCLSLALILLSTCTPQAPAAAPAAETVVLSDPGDPYYPLAEEIAAGEGLPLVQSWAEALQGDPLTVLWVVAPRSLSDPVIGQVGLALKGRAAPPTVGIISGGSLEAARALWQRGTQRRGLADTGTGAAQARLFVANGRFPGAGIFQPRITAVRPGSAQEQDLTTASLTAALGEAAYLTFNGHGGAGYLKIADDVKYTARDLPDLPPLVIGTSSCQTMRLWQADSIALAFADRGAAAYAGFVYSPNAGYLLGEYRGLPFRYTWPAFPIGQVMALQNHGAQQSYAAFPFHYLLGDPRIALNDQPPYTLLSETEQDGARVLSFSAVEAGLVPVRVPAGAGYAFVEIPEVGAAARGDFFFNARVQVLDARGDKYILFDHPGGPFRIVLRRSAPWHWAVTRPLLDSFDHLALFTPQNGGGEIVAVAGLLALAAGMWRIFRRRGALPGSLQTLALTALGIGLSAALVFSVYACLRLPHAAIVTKPLDFNPLWMSGTGLLACAGTLLYHTARSRFGRALAVLITGLPGLLPALFIFGAVGYVNLMAVNQVGASIYNYRLALIPLPAAAVVMLVMWAAYAGLARLQPGG